jgi:pimeloyl-ACP methyl ester carboxylesterase
VSPFEPPAPRATGHVVSADGTRIAYEEHGPRDAPLVVLSHGWTCSTRFWAPVLHRLGGDLRVVAYDQRGHGRSEVPGQRSRYSTEALADDLEAVLERVVPAGQRAVLVGHSMGGMTLMAAAGRPAVDERAAAVLLASTGSSRLVEGSMVCPAFVRGPRARAAFHRALLHSSAPLGPRGPVLRAALKYGVLAPGAGRPEADATTRIVLACHRKPRAAWGHVLSSLDLDARLGQLTAPTAVLVGTADRLTPPAHAGRLAEALPNCLGVVELPGHGHMTPLEAPEAVAGTVRDLVRDHLAAPTAAQQPVKEGESA